MPFIIDFAQSLYFHYESGGILTGMSNPNETPGEREDVDQDWTLYHLEKAIERNVPLFMGVGATQVDRNSIADLDIALLEIKGMTSEYVDAIRTVARSIAENGYDETVPPWPGTVYFEDVSVESSFELIEAIVGTAMAEGAL